MRDSSKNVPSFISIRNNKVIEIEPTYEKGTYDLIIFGKVV
jgi:hypothetical protein